MKKKKLTLTLIYGHISNEKYVPKHIMMIA